MLLYSFLTKGENWRGTFEVDEYRGAVNGKGESWESMGNMFSLASRLANASESHDVMK